MKWRWLYKRLVKISWFSMSAGCPVMALREKRQKFIHQNGKIKWFFEFWWEDATNFLFFDLLCRKKLEWGIIQIVFELCYVTRLWNNIFSVQINQCRVGSQLYINNNPTKIIQTFDFSLWNRTQNHYLSFFVCYRKHVNIAKTMRTVKQDNHWIPKTLSLVMNLEVSKNV